MNFVLKSGSRHRQSKSEPHRRGARIVLCSLSAAFLFGSIVPEAAAQQNLPPVGSARAAALFEAICGKSLPNFNKALRVAKANGVTHKAQTGTMYSTTEDLSVKVFDGPGAGKTCSIVFRSNDSRSKFLRATAALSPDGELHTISHQSSGKTTGSLYEGKALFFVDGPTRSGGKKYYNMKMLSQR